MKNQKRFPLFSNGTEFMIWTWRNCDKCIKAVFYNEKKDIYPKYKCRVICPYIKTERQSKKPMKNNDNELTLF